MSTVSISRRAGTGCVVGVERSRQDSLSEEPFVRSDYPGLRNDEFSCITGLSGCELLYRAPVRLPRRRQEELVEFSRWCFPSEVKNLPRPSCTSIPFAYALDGSVAYVDMASSPARVSAYLHDQAGFCDAEVAVAPSLLEYLDSLVVDLDTVHLRAVTASHLSELEDLSRVLSSQYGLWRNDPALSWLVGEFDASERRLGLG